MEIEEYLGESAYGRRKLLNVGSEFCDRCHETRDVVIGMDSSDGEYGSVSVCMGCLNELADRFRFNKKNSPSSAE